MSAALHSLRHHAHFYLALAAAALVYALGEAVPRDGAVAAALQGVIRPVVAGDTFFAIYLIVSAWVLAGSSPDSIRERAEQQDEGIAVVLLLAVAAVGLCLASNFGMLNAKGDGGPSALVRLGLAGVSVLLAWFTLHTIFAFHYAHRFYADADARDDRRRDAGGLDFPGTAEPDLLDFLYYSYVIGMTAQVSDVGTSTRAMRRLTLGHSVIAFFFNTVILAFAVNAAVGAATG